MLNTVLNIIKSIPTSTFKSNNWQQITIQRLSEFKIPMLNEAFRFEGVLPFEEYEYIQL